jgi:hypothetical protein
VSQQELNIVAIDVETMSIFGRDEDALCWRMHDLVPNVRLHHKLTRTGATNAAHKWRFYFSQFNQTRKANMMSTLVHEHGAFLRIKSDRIQTNITFI